MALVTYRIEYEYYHYNTGRGDNGLRRGAREVATLTEAKTIVDKIEQSRKETNGGVEQTTDAIDTLIHGDGHFNGPAEVYEITKKFIDIT